MEKIINYYNEIKKELVNKKILLSLSVKGNLFCKNPQSNIKLIKKFPKLKYLDSFKITEATYKVINEKDNVGKLLFEAGNKYGENVIGRYSQKLTIEIGKKYDKSTLFKIRKFYIF